MDQTQSFYQGQISQKSNQQGLFSLFMTFLDMMHSSLKFHECISYGLEFMAQIWLHQYTIWNFGIGKEFKNQTSKSCIILS